MPLSSCKTLNSTYLILFLVIFFVCLFIGFFLKIVSYSNNVFCFGNVQPRPIYLVYVKYKKNPKNAGLRASINIYIYKFLFVGFCK